MTDEIKKEEPKEQIIENKEIKIPQSIKIAIYLFIIYAVIILINGAFYIYWSGDYTQFSRGFMRVIGCLLIAYALHIRHALGLWLGIILSVMIFLGFVIIIPSLLNPEFLISRPFPLLDKIVFVMVGLISLANIILLVKPSSRKYFLKKKD